MDAQANYVPARNRACMRSVMLSGTTVINRGARRRRHPHSGRRSPRN